MARDSVEALRQAKEHPVDLVVLNLAMPEGESLEAVHAIRTEQTRIKIIAIAAGRGSAALRTADLLDAQAVLTRPLASTAVLRRVREVLKEHP
jgi:DNA-binding NarL/FixJ family response regulator